MTNGIDKVGLTPEEFMSLQTKLWELLKWRTEMYTAGESSSVPKDVAQDLLTSICFTLGININDEPVRLKSFLQTDLNEAYEIGVKNIRYKIELGKKFWQASIMSVPAVENISLNDTLRGIGDFWRKYDYRYFAHQIPCDIDYQLSNQVPDCLLGVDYINEYLRRLLIENDLLRRFDSRNVLRLLQHSCPDYKGLLINLYEPVAANAIGLKLIGENILPLEITTQDLNKLSAIFESLTPSKTIEKLEEAAEALCAELQICGEDVREYIKKTSVELYPRIEAALPNAGLGGVFISA